jgi:predicted nucleic-acid-binding protein
MGRGAESDPTEAERDAGVTAFVDTNILIRHLTADTPDLAARATRFLQDADELLLPDLILAEVVYVLESFYEVPRDRVAEIARTILAFDAITVIDRDLVLRAVELYEVERLDFADAYLVASAEVTGIGAVASFDRTIGRIPSIQRVEPPRM